MSELREIWHWCCETHGHFYATEHKCPRCLPEEREPVRITRHGLAMHIAIARAILDAAERGVTDE